MSIRASTSTVTCVIYFEVVIFVFIATHLFLSVVLLKRIRAVTTFAPGERRYMVLAFQPCCVQFLAIRFVGDCRRQGFMPLLVGQLLHPCSTCNGLQLLPQLWHLVWESIRVLELSYIYTMSTR